MAGQSRKWMILVATIWIQAFTGTNFDFSAYSSTLKTVLGISQVQLNYLAVASDLGKALGWSSGLTLLYLPLWTVLFIAAFMGAIGYIIQWLIIENIISLPYYLVFLLCLMAGCSICWFNTVCFILCIRNFPVNRALALALTISFNGVSPALYNLAANAISPSNESFYLLLNAVLPLLTSIAALVPILRQPPLDPLPPAAARRDALVFLVLNFLAILTGVYLLVFNSTSIAASDKAYPVVFAMAVLLLILPLGIPGIVYAREWARRTIHSSFQIRGSGFNLVDVDDLELHKELIGRENNDRVVLPEVVAGDKEGKPWFGGCCDWVVNANRLWELGEEHTAWQLVWRVDFWLYYLAYFCGGTVGLVYSNNLGQIVQSLKGSLDETAAAASLVSLYSSCSFFGRLLSAAPDFLREKIYFARTGWLALALIPTPIAFFMLALWSGHAALQVGTALIGLSSGFIFAAAVSITSELYGPNSVGVNHNILITNIPIGSLVYGSLAAVVYDANGSKIGEEGAVVCIGRRCYETTFVSWACISMVALVSSVLFFLRTRPAYDRFERNRIPPQLY